MLAEVLSEMQKAGSKSNAGGLVRQANPVWPGKGKSDKMSLQQMKDAMQAK